MAPAEGLVAQFQVAVAHERQFRVDQIRQRARRPALFLLQPREHGLLRLCEGIDGVGFFPHAGTEIFVAAPAVPQKLEEALGILDGLVAADAPGGARSRVDLQFRSRQLVLGQVLQGGEVLQDLLVGRYRGGQCVVHESGREQKRYRQGSNTDDHARAWAPPYPSLRANETPIRGPDLSD